MMELVIKGRVEEIADLIPAIQGQRKEIAK